MLTDAIRCLRCPHCAADLAADERVLVCANGHAFDIARQGYVNLLPGGARVGTADTAAMVEARDAFLRSGHFASVADVVARLAATTLPEDVPGCVADVGAGTGYYLAAVLDALPQRTGLALDISKAAARRAAKAHGRAASIVCDTWGSIPLRDGAAALLLDVFAPRNGAEFARVLAPGGRLAIVTPTPRHLRELIDTLGLLTVAEDKLHRLEATLGGLFRPALPEAVEHEYVMPLTRIDIGRLVAMGPSSRHAEATALEDRIATLREPVDVTASVRVTVYERA